MPSLITIGLGIFIAAFFVALVNFRFLLYPVIPSLNPITKAKQLALTGNTLFISDLHIRARRSFEFASDLRSFIEQNHVSNLVIVGDLFQSPKDARKILGDSPITATMKILGLDGLFARVFWVTGSRGHDPPNIGLSQVGDGDLNVLGQSASLKCGHLDIIAYHGHDLSIIGAVGHAWDRFIAKLSLERVWRRLAKVNETVWVVFGHTHIPGLDDKQRVANCGGWQRVPLLVRPSGTGIFFSQEKGSLQLVQIARP